MDTLVEASMNFDAHIIREFLERLSVLISGFGSNNVTEVLEAIEDMGIETEQVIRHDVIYEGQKVPLRINIFKDDVDAVDLYFFTVASLAQSIDNLMSEFCRDHGI